MTLSLARGAQVMAERQALVRRLDAVETLGATTFICTAKTGTLTQNRMAVVEVATAAGDVVIEGRGYDPVAELRGREAALAMAPSVAAAAVSCVRGRVVQRDGWAAEGDPLEAAIDCLARRCALDDSVAPGLTRHPYTAERMVSSSYQGGEVAVLGAPEAVFSRCTEVPAHARSGLDDLTGRGRRVLAVARRDWSSDRDDDGMDPDSRSSGCSVSLTRLAPMWRSLWRLAAERKSAWR